MKLSSLCLSILVAQAVQTSDRALTGVWKANESRTLGAVPEEAEIIDCDQSNCRVTVYRRQADVIPTYRYIVDNKDRVSGQEMINAHWEGAKLVVDERSLAGGTVRYHASFEVSENGNVMTKTEDRTSASRTEHHRLIFDKISSGVELLPIRVGQSMNEVKNAWGNPDEVFESGSTITYVYFNWHCGRLKTCSHRIVFAHGQVIEIHR